QTGQRAAVFHDDRPGHEPGRNFLTWIDNRLDKLLPAQRASGRRQVRSDVAAAPVHLVASVAAGGAWVEENPFARRGLASRALPVELLEPQSDVVPRRIGWRGGSENSADKIGSRGVLAGKFLQLCALGFVEFRAAKGAECLGANGGVVRVSQRKQQIALRVGL